MTHSRRGWLAAAGALVLGARGLGAAHASVPFPSRPITLWVPWPAGGATDTSLLPLAELASQVPGQTVITDNRSGAGGTLAMPILQRAEPDGYTIAQMPQPVFRAPHVQKVLWDPIRDVTPIIQVSGVTFGVLVPAGSERPALHPRAVQGHGRADQRDHGGAGDGWRQLHRVRPGRRRRAPAPARDSCRAALEALAQGADAARTRLRHRRDVALRPGRAARLARADRATLHDAFKRAMFEPRFIQELAKYDQEIDHLGPKDYARACREICARERINVDRPSPPRGASRGG